MATALTEVGTRCIESTVMVFEGVVYVATRDDEWILTPGDSAHVAAGVGYRSWDAGDDEARWTELHCAAAS